MSFCLERSGQGERLIYTAPILLGWSLEQSRVSACNKRLGQAAILSSRTSPWLEHGLWNVVSYHKPFLIMFDSDWRYLFLFYFSVVFVISQSLFQLANGHNGIQKHLLMCHLWTAETHGKLSNVVFIWLLCPNKVFTFGWNVKFLYHPWLLFFLFLPVCHFKDWKM